MRKIDALVIEKQYRNLRSQASSLGSQDLLNERKNKMISKKQFLANEQNALRSTGPRSAAGKATASQNGVRHGRRDDICPLLPEIWSLNPDSRFTKRTHFPWGLKTFFLVNPADPV